MTEIDQLIGKKIRQARKSRGLSQIELAEKIDVSFQQIQKYEKGITKIPIYRLQEISQALNLKITAFFEELYCEGKVSDHAEVYESGKAPHEVPQLLSDDEAAFLKLFRKIRNKKLRDGLLQHLRGIIEVERSKR